MLRAISVVCCLSVLLTGCSHFDRNNKVTHPSIVASVSDSLTIKSPIVQKSNANGFFYSPIKRSNLINKDWEKCANTVRSQNEFHQIERCMNAQGYRYYELPNSSLSQSQVRLDIRRAIATYNNELNALNEDMTLALNHKTCLRGELTTANMHRIRGDISAKELAQIIYFLEKDVHQQEVMMKTIGPWLKNSDHVKRLIDGRKSMIESLKQSKRPISWAAYNLYNHRHISYDRFIEMIKSQELKF